MHPSWKGKPTRTVLLKGGPADGKVVTMADLGKTEAQLIRNSSIGYMAPDGSRHRYRYIDKNTATHVPKE